jgi:hypothetical protein
MKKQFNIGDLCIYNRTCFLMYISDISKDRLVVTFYMDHEEKWTSTDYPKDDVSGFIEYNNWTYIPIINRRIDENQF